MIEDIQPIVCASTKSNMGSALINDEWKRLLRLTNLSCAMEYRIGVLEGYVLGLMFAEAVSPQEGRRLLDWITLCSVRM